MATFEEFGVLLEIIMQTFRLVRNWRTNAGFYQAAIVAGQSASVVGQKMKADATAFHVRLQMVTDLATRNQTLVQNALGIIGVTLAQANTLKTSLVALGDHILAAPLNSGAQVTAEAEYILANTPAYDGFFGS